MNRSASIILVLGLWFYGSCTIVAQNQRVADSLIQLLNRGETAPRDSLRLEWLAGISFNHNNPDSVLYYTQLMEAETDDPKWLYNASYYKGTALRMKGDLEGSLRAYFKSLSLAKEGDLRRKEAFSNQAIGDVYSISDAHRNSIEYYSKSIGILRELKDSLNLATVLFNLGDEYLNQDSLNSAIPYFEESRKIFERIDYPSGVAYTLGNIGMVYAKQGDKVKAAENIDLAIGILEGQEDYYAISEYLTYMSDIYFDNGNAREAIDYAERSLLLATNYGLKEQISESNLKLSQLYDKIGDPITSYRYYKTHIIYRDSVKNLESVQQMANLRTEYEVSQKQAEVNLLNQEKKTQRTVMIGTGIALFSIAILAIGLFRRNQFIQRTKKIIEEEKGRSENLLLNILPEETAAELKKNGAVKAKKYDSVSVLFSDFKGFTSYSENLSPEALVETVDFYFSKFDAIIEKHGLEKIKTIGDAYMCAGGLYHNKRDHAQKMVKAAIEIAAFVEETKSDDTASELAFDIRIGISSGPVVAGVVGTKKFAYDIWGDTVNVASRMESMSEPGKINISESTYDLVRDQWDCTYRGEIEVKNRGVMKMYFVNT